MREGKRKSIVLNRFILIVCISYNSEKSRGSGTLITLGAVTIGTLGILTYAKLKKKKMKTLHLRYQS